MALNIKNEDTNQLVSKLASATGLSLTEAVKVAVEEKLSRLESNEERSRRILASGADCASRLPDWLKKETLENSTKGYPTNPW